MTAPQYAAMAEACLARSDAVDSPDWALVNVGAAQVWATLALAAATESTEMEMVS